jgi:DNA polymerase-3 subunit alpha
MFLIFDTETTGLPKKWNAPLSDSDNWPRCVQIAWQIHDFSGLCVESKSFIIKPEGYTIPYESEKIHGISTSLANLRGEKIENVLKTFLNSINNCTYICGHNVKFDINIIGAELIRLGNENKIEKFPIIDSCSEVTAEICKLPGGRGGKFKFPTLSELYLNLFNKNFKEAHNATADVEATSRCLIELFRRKLIKNESINEIDLIYNKIQEKFKDVIPVLGIEHESFKIASEELKKKEDKLKSTALSNNIDSSDFQNKVFSHLHVHSQFSILQSTSKISNLISKAIDYKMPAIALTDHANLMGSFRLIKEVKNYNIGVSDDENKIKPIIGCEFFVCENYLDKTRRSDGYQIVFLAKNKKGYDNLSKMSSISFKEGFYYVPRIDKSIVEKYKDDLIVLTGNLYGEVPSKILNIGLTQGEESLLWWKKNFGDDLYLEIMRHSQDDEDVVNENLISLANKHKISLVATNNTYYTEKSQANAHDILLCLKDGEKQVTPIGKGRGFRYGLMNHEYYFKSQEEMKELFSDTPEAINSIGEIINKIEYYDLSREVLLPKFNIPESFKEFNNEDDSLRENKYLEFLTYEGAKKRYGTISEEIKDRIDFELKVISNTGYPGYFLIVQDFISASKKMGVSVGPGRGSAAGSVVAFCLEITNIDPIKYNLLFERFLNPDRISLPDIDVDFDDEGRSKVLDYVIEKYGLNQVAQIITYGTMAAKSSIRDTARVLDVSLSDADRIAKLVPNISLNEIFNSSNEELKERLRVDEYSRVKELKELIKGDDLIAQTLKQAQILEGTIRNTGTHACGIIITPDDITNFVPVARAKDSNLFATQFDNSVVEDAGLLKMDFLGLKTLTLIKETCKLVKYKHNIDLDPDLFPLDDKTTYDLFQRGDTVGIFQYESLGMKKYLRELKPTVFGDLIAMNALYRPGPLDYIPSFVARKNGKESIVYDLVVMEEFLKETYGITVYQEQVMLLSQKIASFSKGDADLLRKAMGKKIINLLNNLKPKFIKGGKINGHDEEILEKIWKDWEAFASYAFNKSHSTCYAFIGYQTAYLKAHYPAEFMAAVLSNNMNDIKQVTFFMEECRRMGLNVLGPDVNESFYKFTVNKKKEIRFGMGAVKGVGKNSVNTIVENRKEKKYNSVFDLVKRIDLRAANKKTFENLILAGGLDSFEQAHRAQYFNPDVDGITFLERTLRYGSKYQENLNSSQISLFGEKSEKTYQDLTIPPCEKWNNLIQLKREKEVVGIYISAHPLDDFKQEIKHFVSISLSNMIDLNPLINKEFWVAGIINDVENLETKNGRSWAKFIVEDFTDQFEFRIFGEDYLKFRHFLVVNQFIRIKILVKEGWYSKENGRQGDPRIQFMSFELLEDTIIKNSKKLTFQININQIKDGLVERIENNLNGFKGNKHLFFDIYDNDEKIKITLNSKKNKIDITPKLLKELDKEDFDFKLN